MNFDFSEREFVFLADVEQKTAGFVQGKDTDLTGQAGGLVKGLMKELARTPYLKLGIEKVEGMGLSTLAAAWEGVASRAPSLYLPIEASARVFARVLARHGAAEQKAKWLAPALEGKILGAVALSERTMNIENEAFTTQAAPAGDGFTLTGAKGHVAGALYADVFAVAASMEGGIGIFLVERGASGLNVEAPLHSIAYPGAGIAAITLNGVAVSKNSAMGPIDPQKTLTALRTFENQVLLGASLGAMRAAFDSAKKYAKEHQSGGKPIIAYQEVGFKLAEMLTMFQTSQLLTYRALWLAETGDPEAAGVLLAAKVFCAESAEAVASGALQILAGKGLVAGNPAEKGYRNAKYVQIAGTSTELSRVKLGDMALGYTK
jgi:alkylation response protein AidB-like acyl-CoA dehydrogenase